MRYGKFWLSWLALVIGLAAYLGYALTRNDAKVYLVGDMTHAHHQIELACDSCHGDAPFGGLEIMQTACVDCHADDLKAGDDSHPKAKFTDPRNADRVAKLDARYCVTCHVEHKPEITRAMGVTLPDDFCVECHADIATERSSHAGLEFDTCASAGCHNFHDNQALYEDFLLKHADAPALQPVARRPVAGKNALRDALTRHPVITLTAQDADTPTAFQADQRISYDWETTAHAQAAVNCSDCHTQDLHDGAGPLWRAKPGPQACQQCHTHEVKGFLGGLHGMRRAVELPPMRPADAQLPMHKARANSVLSCNSCHSAHQFDRTRAAAVACLTCHADEHSNNYQDSPHAALWRQEQAGTLPAGSGVSCATCHLPREAHVVNGVKVVLAQHNQNANLRPNEKMLRTVCMDCHGLGFAIDALADADLIKRNFNGQPATHIPSIDWAVRRLETEATSGSSTQREGMQ